MAYVLKIGVIGSEACGKTRFCNYLGSINGTSEYTPTVGVRIVELSEQVTVVNPKKEKQKIYDVPITVQLWDCSSNSKYSHLWSAWAHDLHGLIMFKPKEISTLRDQFKVFKKPLKRGSCFLTIADHPSQSLKNCIVLNRWDEKEFGNLKTRFVEWLGKVVGLHPEIDFDFAQSP